MNRILLLLLLWICPPSLFAGSPTTPEQRNEIVRVARALEEDPFGPGADRLRGKTLELVEEASDMVIEINLAMIKELMASKIPHRVEVFGQFLLGLAACAIEHPEQAKDPQSNTFAAFSSALKVYRKAVERDAANRIAFWDELVAHERAGTLETRIKQLVEQRKPKVASKNK